MEISARCRECGKSYHNVPAKFAGRTIRCKNCGGSVAVPANASGGEDDWDRIGFEGPPIPSRASSRAGTRAARRGGRGVPTWVWPVAGLVVLIGAVGATAVLVPWKDLAVRTRLIEPDEERIARQFTEAQEELATIVEGITDAVSAESAARRIETDFAERIESAVLAAVEVAKRRKELPPDELAEAERRDKAANDKYGPRIDDAERRQRAAGEKLAQLPAEARTAIVQALQRMNDRTRDVRLAMVREQAEERLKKERERVEARWAAEEAERERQRLLHEERLREQRELALREQEEQRARANESASSAQNPAPNPALAPPAGPGAGRRISPPAFAGRGFGPPGIEGPGPATPEGQPSTGFRTPPGFGPGRSGLLVQPDKAGPDEVLFLVSDVPRDQSFATFAKIREVVGINSGNGGGSFGKLWMLIGPTTKSLREIADAVPFGKVTGIDESSRIINVRWTGGG